MWATQACTIPASSHWLLLNGCCHEKFRFRFRIRYHYAATRAWCVPKNHWTLLWPLFTCLVFVFIKPRKQTHVRERGSSMYFLIYVVCIYVCVCSFPSKTKNWGQEQKFGPRGWLQCLISSILQHVFQRSLSFPVGWSFPSIWMDSQLCNGDGIRRQIGVDQRRIWCNYTS